MEQFPASEYVAAMCHSLKLDLCTAERRFYCEAVEMVQQARHQVIDVRELHRILFGSGVGAGVFRTSAVVDLRGVSFVTRDFPRYTAIPQLMFSFMRAYRKALMGDVTEEVVNFAALAWQIAANGRCIHPFMTGNTRLFLLIENHIRQVHGLPWTIGLRQKKDFDRFREAYKVYHADFFS